MRDGSFHVADADEVAQPQRARVRHHEAGHDLIHESARAEGHHQAKHDADASEGVGLASGQVRICQHHGERPHERRRQAPRGQRGLRIDPAEPDASAFDAAEPQTEQPDDEARDQKDDDRGEHSRNAAHEAECQILGGPDQERAHRLAPRPRIRKTPENEGDGGITDHDVQGNGGRSDDPARGERVGVGADPGVRAH